MIGTVTLRILQRPFQVLFFITAATVILVGGPARASVLIDTNVAGVVVPDQSQKTQKAAVREAFERVLVKTSGRRHIVENEEIKRHLRNPDQYLRSYRYEARTDGLYYIAEFDQQALLQLLRQQQLPVWGNRRPDTIMWLAVEQNTRRYIVDEAHLSDIRQTVVNSAQRRGISVSLPLMDLTDNQAISVFDVWGRFARSLSEASERYGVDYVIGARLYRNNKENESLFADQQGASTGTGFSAPEAQVAPDDQTLATAGAANGEYAIDWVFIGKDETQVGTLYGDTEVEVTQQLMDDYADYLGKMFAVQSGDDSLSSTPVRISVANLNSLSKYVHAQRYLESLSVVGQARLVRQDQSVGDFELVLLGTLKDLTNTLGLESKLQPVRDAFGQPLEGLNFYWNENN